MRHFLEVREVKHASVPARRSLAAFLFRRPERESVRLAAAAGVEALESRMLLSTTLIPTEDTFVRNNAFRNTNYGQSPLLGVKSASSGDSRTAFLKFDLAGIDPEVAVATLRVGASLQNAESGPTVVGIFGVQDTAWVEGNGQWAFRDRTADPLDTSRRITGHGDGYDRDNRPSGEMTWNNQPASNSAPIDTVTIDSDLLRTYSFDVTTYVREALAEGKEAISLALKNPDPADDFSRVLSREFSGGEPRLVITPSGTPAPAASVSAANINGPGTSHTITVTYRGETIDAAMVAVDDLTVLDPSGVAMEVADVAVTQQGASVVATYTINAPGGEWDAADNGVYRAAVNQGTVSGAGGESTAALAEFRVAVGDTTAPSVVITPVAPVEGETTFSFIATFTDDVAIDVTTINIDNFEVKNAWDTGLGFTNVTIVPTENAGTVIATYTAEAPGGPGNSVWHPGHDGDYAITLREKNVRDTAGNGVARTTQPYTVDLGASDDDGPAAEMRVRDVTSPDGTSHTVRIDYSDPSGIDVTSIGTDDLRITGPGGARLPVTGFTLGADDSATARRVTYTFAAPGGAWESSDNGSYQVRLNADQVLDTRGNAAAEKTATFSVDAVSPDQSGPTAVIEAADVTGGAIASQTITVTYSDDVAVDVGTIGTDDLTVTGPTGPLTVTAATPTAGAAGSPVTVAYAVEAPNGEFTAADSGEYTIVLDTDSVTDTSDNAAEEASAAFAVAIAGGDPRDPTFDSVAPRFTAQSVATQSNGKIIVAGYLGNPNGDNSRAVVERRNSDGTIDTSFGSEGQIFSDQGANDAWFAVVVQGDKIVTAGTRDGNFVLTRFDAAGDIDTSFGQQGSAFADFGDNDAAYALAIAPDGKLVAAGSAGGNFAFARFTSQGITDTTFAQAGMQLFAVGDDSDGLGAVAVQGDGKIVAVGARGAAVAVVRLNADGEADTSFSGDGLLLVGGLTAARTGDDFPDHSQAVAIQADGKILVSNRTPDGDFGLARVTTTGDLDSTFGDNGLAIADFGGEADVDALVLQQTGQIIAVGTALIDGEAKTGVAAFDSNGHLITTFGEGGKITVDVNLVPLERELHVGDLVLRAFGARQDDGRLLVGTGNRGPSSSSTSTLSRLLVPGSSTRAQPQESVIGSFGVVDGQKVKLSFTDSDGTIATFVLTGAAGMAFADGDTVRLSITDLGPAAKLKVKTAGGDGRITLGDVTVTGSLKNLTGKGADLTGSLYATGVIGKVNIGNISGGTIASAGGSIRNIRAFSMSGARILSGANLGSDNRLGNGDAFAGGAIGAVKVTGAITSSVIGAGYDPGADGDFFDDDNTIVGGAASTIRSIVAKAGADNASRFAAGTFGKVKIPLRVTPAADSRFDIG